MSNTIQDQGPKNYEAMRARIEAARKSEAAARPCCEWHRTGGLKSVACRATVSDDGGWNDGAAAQMATYTSTAVPFTAPPTPSLAVARTPGTVSAIASDPGDMPADRAPRSTSPLPRDDARARLHQAIDKLPPSDVAILSAIVAELPGLRLLAVCEAETARGVEGETPIKLDPTPRRVVALCALLGAWRAFEGLVLPRAEHMPRRGVRGYLRGEVGAVDGKETGR